MFTPAPGNNGFGSVQYTVTNTCDVSRNGSVSIDVNRSPSSWAARSAQPSTRR